MRATLVVVEQAVEVLDSAPGIMVRQPLARACNPLAAADYHSVAAPYRHMFEGCRAKTRAAFVYALTVVLERPSEAGSDRLMYEELIGPALEAFASDYSYAAAMARTAVGLRYKHAVWDARVELRQASAAAVRECSSHDGEFMCMVESPCGTGKCRYAHGDLIQLSDPSHVGKSARPRNHADQSFDVEVSVRPLQSMRATR